MPFTCLFTYFSHVTYFFTSRFTCHKSIHITCHNNVTCFCTRAPLFEQVFRQACVSSPRRFRPRSCISRCVVGLAHLARPGLLSREVEQEAEASLFSTTVQQSNQQEANSLNVFGLLVGTRWHPSPAPSHMSRLVVVNHQKCEHQNNFLTTTPHYAALFARNGRHRRHRSSKGTANSTNDSRCARGAVVTGIILVVMFGSPAATRDTLPRALLTSATAH